MIFRYNVLSLMYLLLFMASLVLPGPHLKTQKGEVHVHVHVHLLINGDKIETQISKFTIYEYIDTCVICMCLCPNLLFFGNPCNEMLTLGRVLLHTQKA